MRILPALLVLAATTVFAAAATAATPLPGVAKLILRTTQVGDGYMLAQRQDGFGVKNTITLDLCGRSNYPSEKLRTDRLQVNYIKQGTTLGLSNEVVSYKPGGAAKALAEVTSHALNCPHRPIPPGDPSLPPLTFSFTRVSDEKLLKDYLAVKVHVTGKVKGKKIDEVSYAVYQRLGDLLSGTYSFGPDTPAQRRFVLHAAEQSGKNLLLGKAVGGPTA